VKATIRYYPSGYTKRQQLKVYATDAQLNVRDPFVAIRFPTLGIGADVSVEDAGQMGLSMENLKLAIDEPIEVQMKLEVF
jgi:hypothetical protein